MWTDDAVVMIRFAMPRKSVSRVIGTKGSVVNGISKETGATISFGEGLQMPPTVGSNLQMCRIQGTLRTIEMAVTKICGELASESQQDQQEPKPSSNGQSMIVLLPADKIPLMVGKKGVIVKGIESEAGVMVSISKDNLFGDQCVTLVGPPENIGKAITLVANSMSPDCFDPSQNKQPVGQGAVPAMGQDPSMGYYGAPGYGWQQGGFDADGRGGKRGPSAATTGFAGYGMPQPFASKRARFQGTGEGEAWTEETSVQVNYAMQSGFVSKVIGSKGTVVGGISRETGAIISFGEKLTMPLSVGSDLQMCRVQGTLLTIEMATLRICQLADADPSTGLVSLVILLPSKELPLLVGKKGVVVQSVQNEAGCMISIQKDTVETSQCVILMGAPENIARAVTLVAKTMPATAFPKDAPTKRQN